MPCCFSISTRLAIETCAPGRARSPTRSSGSCLDSLKSPAPICARGLSCHFVAYVSVMSDQSVPFRVSAAPWRSAADCPRRDCAATRRTTGRVAIRCTRRRQRRATGGAQHHQLIPRGEGPGDQVDPLRRVVHRAGILEGKPVRAAVGPAAAREDHRRPESISVLIRSIRRAIRYPCSGPRASRVLITIAFISGLDHRRSLIPLERE